MEHKKCNKCFDDKPIDCFGTYQKREVKYIRNACKVCDNKRTLEYKKLNKDKTKIHKKTYREKNKPKIRATQKTWRDNNPEKVQIIRKRYKKNNIEKINSDKKAYIKKNIEELKNPYIIHLIKKTTKVQLKNEESNKNIIDYYREKVILNRKLRELKTKIKNS